MPLHRKPSGSPDFYDITVFGAEPHANYNRMT
jgi:NAD(P)H-nitrite reductase large subunit